MGFKRKTLIADKVRKNKGGIRKKHNPFEVKINRQKHNVLGQRLSRHEKGNPGLSRSKANKRREETLLPEYKNRYKANKFIDKRIGEHDTKLTVEEKMQKRFSKEQEKQQRNNKYSLNDEEELTHFGQSLSEIEKLEDPSVSDDEDDADRGKIGASVVSEEHFGGGFLRRKNDEEENKSWKEKMEDIIVKSKKEKYERQSEREKGQKLTQEVDQQWKDVQHLVSSLRPAPGSIPGFRVDDYDVAVRELRYEIKAQATDRLKTPEEIAREEKEKLEKLESERLMRMKGIVDTDVKSSTHVSVDDLHDGFILNKPDQTEALQFKDGKLSKVSFADDNVDNSDDEESDDSAEDDDENQKDDDDNNQQSDDNEDNSECVSESDFGSDTQETDDPPLKVVNKGSLLFGSKGVKSILKKSILSEEQLEARASVIEAAKKEIPYTFQAPATYDDLLRLLEGHSSDDQITIILRVQACHHRSLGAGNKQKLEMLLELLVQYFGEACAIKPYSPLLIDKLTCILYELTQQSSAVAAKAFLTAIHLRQEIFSQTKGKRSKYSTGIGLDTLLYLKLISVLFPTSDFWHPLTTPALLFIVQMLQFSVNAEKDVANGLFLCNLVLQFVSLSKRFVPEVLNYLHGVLFLAAVKQPNKVERVFPPFKPVGPAVNMLVVTSKKAKKCELKPFKLLDIYGNETNKPKLSSDDFRVNAVNCALGLLHEFTKMYKDLPSFYEIFQPMEEMCCKLPKDNYPESVQISLDEFIEVAGSHNNSEKGQLVMQKVKPKPLKLFEPSFREEWTGRKQFGGSREFNDKKRVQHKSKQEFKGALREMRKDTQFLAREQFKEMMHKDDTRKRKVKELYSSLANQEGDYKRLLRENK